MNTLSDKERLDFLEDQLNTLFHLTKGNVVCIFTTPKQHQRAEAPTVREVIDLAYNQFAIDRMTK